MNRRGALIGLFASLIITAAARAADYQYPYQNPDLPLEQRVDNLLKLLTVEEKIACFGNNPSVPRLGIIGSNQVEGLHGLELSQPGHSQDQAGGARGGVAGNAAGAPAGVAGRAAGGGRAGRGAGGGGRGGAAPAAAVSTTYPQEVGMGETWDTALIHRAAAAEGNEMRYASETTGRSRLVLRAPNADLARDPRWGRTEESFGEDAFFNGTMVVNFVKGLQGDDPKYIQAASLMKHFFANSNEDTRTSSSSNMDERLLREYYTVPFRMGILEGNAQGFMASYNRVNGIPMTCSPLLRSLARKDWNFDGIICTDGSAMSLLVTAHKYFDEPAPYEHAAAATVKTSIGQYLDNNGIPGTRMAIADKLLTEADLDDSLRGVFRVMFRLGMMDPPDKNPYAKIDQGIEPWNTADHRSLARLVTEKSIVLLKNTNNALPLNQGQLKSIAVIGDKADVVLYDWYSGQPPYAITPLEAIKSKVGYNVAVNFAANNNNGAAVALAKASDVAIVIVGNHPTCDAPWNKSESTSEGKESVDRKTINLDDEDLIKQVYAANPKTVVVLISSFPYAINWTQENVPAILHMTHCSQEEGSALADAIFGDYNPAGRLVATWPQSLDQLPPLLDYDLRHGRTYMYFKGQPLYPFGFGLSYTTFEYTNLKTSAETLEPDGSIDVTVDVKNTGTRDGEEVVQLYVKHLNSKVDRPIKELRGFTRVPIAAGGTRNVKLTLPASRLAYWDATQGRWVVEPDQIQLQVGSSSADVRLDKTIAVGG